MTSLQRSKKFVYIAAIGSVFCLPLGFGTWFYWHSSGEAIYIPVEFNPGRHGGFVDHPEWSTPEHLDRMEKTLAYYNEWFRRASKDRLLIRRWLVEDRDLLMNFTSHAMGTGNVSP